MSQEERLVILQMVADKKISAAEAAELLRALDGIDSPEPRPSADRGPRPDPSEAPTPLSGLSAFIERAIDRINSVITEVVGPRYEFPTELTGHWAGEEVPLRIVAGNGRVEISGWDQPGYKATILVKATGSNEEDARIRARDAFVVKADEHGFDLEAQRLDPGEAAVHLSLMVPRQKRYRLEGRTGNGRMEVEQILLTEARMTSGNGRISLLGGAAERATLKSGNGAIQVESDVADLEAGAGNGSVSVTPTGNRSQSMRLSTGNGSVRVGLERLPAGFGCKVEGHTGMGSVSLNLPELVFERNVRSVAHKHVIAQTENFDHSPVPVTVSARTGMGSITIE